MDIPSSRFTWNINLFYKKNVFRKMSLKTPKILGKCLENLQPQITSIFRNVDFS